MRRFGICVDSELTYVISGSGIDVRRFRMQINSKLTCVDSELTYVILEFQNDAPIGKF